MKKLLEDIRTSLTNYQFVCRLYIRVSQTIFFPTRGESLENVPEGSLQELREIAVSIYMFPELEVTIEGYADAQPYDNVQLSKDRAMAAKAYILDYLRQQGVSDDEIRLISERIKDDGKGVIPGSEGENQAHRKIVIKIKGGQQKISEAAEKFIEVLKSN